MIIDNLIHIYICLITTQENNTKVDCSRRQFSKSQTSTLLSV